MTYVRLVQPTTCERCGRDLPRRAEAWRGADGVSATCLHCLADAPSPTPPVPDPAGGEIVDLTAALVVEPVADDELVLPDPGGRATPVSDRRQRALTEADLAPVGEAVPPISAAARPRRRRRRD